MKVLNCMVTTCQIIIAPFLFTLILFTMLVLILSMSISYLTLQLMLSEDYKISLTGIVMSVLLFPLVVTIVLCGILMCIFFVIMDTVYPNLVNHKS